MKLYKPCHGQGVLGKCKVSQIGCALVLAFNKIDDLLRLLHFVQLQFELGNFVSVANPEYCCAAKFRNICWSQRDRSTDSFTVGINDETDCLTGRRGLTRYSIVITAGF